MPNHGTRRPDYNLKVMDKFNDFKGRIGAGWQEEDGSISIALDPLVVLSERSGLVIKLFPNNYPKPTIPEKKEGDI
jgi:hypothetical protein